jgi:hypothetical protein
MLALIASSRPVARAPLIVSLLAVSLPSLVSWLLLDFVVRVKQGRKGSIVRGLAIMLGLAPSLVALVLMLGSFSWLAAVFFLVLIAWWFLALDVVTYLGTRRNSEI